MPRTSGFSVPEDILLCHLYVNMSQDNIKGKNQSGDEFWGNIMQCYNIEATEKGFTERNLRSLQSRISTIKKDVGKMIPCLKQVEYRHISGATQADEVSILEL